jgi:isopentenyl-diphosphate delta-isomerase
MSEILDVVNDNDEVTGQAERDEVHRIGLVCRLVYVCFYTADGEILLQKRSNTKKNDAGKLTTTVSGHVASGQSYLEAAVRESLEESGVEVSAGDLVSLGVVRADYTQGPYLSNAMRGLFAYKFNGNITDLKVEDGDGAGFITLSIEELEKQLDSQPEKFAMVLADKVGRDLIQGIKKLLDN